MDVKMVVLPVPQVSWQYQTPIRFPAVKPGLILQEAEKALLVINSMSAIGGIDFTKKWRAETLQRGLEFDNFKPRVKSCTFERIFCVNGSTFGDIDRGFWKS